MNLAEKARRDIDALIKEKGTRNLGQIATLLHNHVLQVHQPGQEGDPAGPSPSYGNEAWMIAFRMLIDPHEWVLPAERMLRELRDYLLERQIAENRHFDTARLCQCLTESQYARDSYASAFRWALHTRAAEMLADRGSADVALGPLWLFGAFGVPHDERGILDEIASQCRDQAQSLGQWQGPNGFPEEVVRRLSARAGTGSSFFSRLLDTEEFPISPVYLRVLLKEAANAPEIRKGQSLEDIAVYLFGLIPGCVPRRNVMDIARAAEHDLVVANHAQLGSLTSELFGRYFLVECKNWATPVRVSDVGYFLFRLRQAKATFGVMFARGGVTGKQDAEDNARALIRRSFHEDGITCVVIDEDDLQALAVRGGRSFQSLLLRRLEEMRYGTPKASLAQPS